MTSRKISITCRPKLLQKYGEDGLAGIEEAIRCWCQEDARRGIETLHLDLADTSALEKVGAPPVTGRVTPNKVKRTVDALYDRLAPDYLVILGSGDVVPFFDVPNPSFHPADGDPDPTVPTDNPYACSRRFVRSKPQSYLIPDRVVGRIPDLPGANDPRWLIEYLSAASSWQPESLDEEPLLVCCEAWRGSGEACVKFLGHRLEGLLLSPPADSQTGSLVEGLGARLHMIKCHGMPLDASFYGQKGVDYPVVLNSEVLRLRPLTGTVVGAMCCYGAALFDPEDPAAVTPGWSPIASRYLRQGAYGFAGSSTVAWVGYKDMRCADLLVSSFLRGVLQGASLGRALLDAKLDLAQSVEKQGRHLDLAEEKTLLQFHLLGDSSIHPASSLIASTGPVVAAALQAASVPVRGLDEAEERRSRRVFRKVQCEQLRDALPTRAPAGSRAVQQGKHLKPVVEFVSRELGEPFRFAFEEPVVHEVLHSPKGATASSRAPRRALAPAAAIPSQELRRAVVGRETLEYYWMAKRTEGPVREIRLLKIETNLEGQVLSSEILSSC